MGGGRGRVETGVVRGLFGIDTHRTAPLRRFNTCHTVRFQNSIFDGLDFGGGANEVSAFLSDDAYRFIPAWTPEAIVVLGGNMDNKFVRHLARDNRLYQVQRDPPPALERAGQQVIEREIGHHQHSCLCTISTIDFHQPVRVHDRLPTCKVPRDTRDLSCPPNQDPPTAQDDGRTWKGRRGEGEEGGDGEETLHWGHVSCRILGFLSLEQKAAKNSREYVKECIMVLLNCSQLH